MWHGGAVFGSQTVVVLLPEKNVGFSIVINCEDGESILGLMDEILDHYLGFAKTDWTARYVAYKKQKIAGGLEALVEIVKAGYATILDLGEPGAGPIPADRVEDVVAAYGRAPDISTDLLLLG